MGGFTKDNHQVKTLTVAGQVPTIPDPPTAIPDDVEDWDNATDLLIGQYAINTADGLEFIRSGNTTIQTRRINEQKREELTIDAGDATIDIFQSDVLYSTMIIDTTFSDSNLVVFDDTILELQGNFTPTFPVTWDRVGALEYDGSASKLNYIYIKCLKSTSTSHVIYEIKRVGEGGGGGAPGGNDTQVQTNDAGAFGGSEMYWDKVNDRLGINEDTPLSKVHINGTGGIDKGLALGDVGDTGLFELSPGIFAFMVGGKEMLRLVKGATAAGDQVIISPESVSGSTGTPGLGFGISGNSGFTESANGNLQVIIEGVRNFNWVSTNFRAISSLGPQLKNESSTATNPTVNPVRVAGNAGLGGVSGSPALISDGISRGIATPDGWKTTGDDIHNEGTGYIEYANNAAALSALRPVGYKYRLTGTGDLQTVQMGI